MVCCYFSMPRSSDNELIGIYAVVKMSKTSCFTSELVSVVCCVIVNSA